MDRLSRSLMQSQRHCPGRSDQAGPIVSEIMRLTDLAPSIQKELLFLPKTIAGPDRIREKALWPVARSLDWDIQKKQFAEVKVGGAAQSVGTSFPVQRRERAGRHDPAR